MERFADIYGGVGRVGLAGNDRLADLEVDIGVPGASCRGPLHLESSALLGTSHRRGQVGVVEVRFYYAGLLSPTRRETEISHAKESNLLFGYLAGNYISARVTWHSTHSKAVLRHGRVSKQRTCFFSGVLLYFQSTSLYFNRRRPERWRWPSRDTLNHVRQSTDPTVPSDL